MLVQVAGQCHDLGAGRVVNLFRRLLEVGLRATAQRHLGAFFRERLRARAAQTLAGSTDDRDLALQSEIHGDRSVIVPCVVWRRYWSAAGAPVKTRGFAPVEETDGAGNEEKEPDARYLWTRS